MSRMYQATHVPASGEVFRDARGDRRALRVSWHRDAGVVVLSLWREHVCVGTFRLPVDEVVTLVELLRGVLDEAYGGARASLLAGLGMGEDDAG